ncbi:MAG: lytic transglycosylase domain-containing protein [Acidobacteria bacterium]|nr:lytic transglycosylase domain-containing protein [Acidobacteriota bacterium]MCW5947904.1 lytic transglycosylase domain-containing protein [Pyrinomonadaceae bacterium]
MHRYALSILFVLISIAASGAIYFPSYWIHRYDTLIERQARVYRLDEKLVWSIIYEETYFRAWKVGSAGEIGLMQVTPAVAREWARETGLKELERQAADDVIALLTDPERNIQVGCWYLEKIRERYRGLPAETAMTLSAYNAGPSRVNEWSADADTSILSEADFVSRIAIPSTRSYVTSILERYRTAQLVR